MHKIRTVDPISVAISNAIRTAQPRTTIAEMADRLGVSYYVLRNMAAGRTVPTEDIVSGIRKQLKLPKTWPYEQPKQGALVSIRGVPLEPIKVVGSVSAGAGEYNVDPDEREIYVPYTLAQIGGLGWVVEGDSMMPDLEPGTVAIFREWHDPKRGFTFLIEAPDKGVRVKNLAWRDGQWMMESLNPAYAPVPLGDNRLLGFLIGWYRVRGLRETMDSDPNGLLLLNT